MGAKTLNPEMLKTKIHGLYWFDYSMYIRYSSTQPNVRPQSIQNSYRAYHVFFCLVAHFTCQIFSIILLKTHCFPW